MDSPGIVVGDESQEDILIIVSGDEDSGQDDGGETVGTSEALIKSKETICNKEDDDNDTGVKGGSFESDIELPRSDKEMYVENIVESGNETSTALFSVDVALDVKSVESCDDDLGGIKDCRVVDDFVTVSVVGEDQVAEPELINLDGDPHIQLTTTVTGQVCGDGAAEGKSSVLKYSREFLIQIGLSHEIRKIAIPIQSIIRNQTYDKQHGGTPNIKGLRQGNKRTSPTANGNGGLEVFSSSEGQWMRGQSLIPSPKPLRRVIELTRGSKLDNNNPNAWKPNRRTRREKEDCSSDLTPDQKQTEQVVKQTRGILNKLTPENFDKLCEQFLKLELNGCKERVSAVISVVFEKAVDEPSFASAYARMIKYVCQHSQETAQKFQKQILDQSQKEFQKTTRDENTLSLKEKQIEEAPEDKKAALREELEDFRVKMRRRSLGNIRFIGELFKLQMLTPKIMVFCVQMLLGNKDEESYECLCKLMTTVGQLLENALKEQENLVRDARARKAPLPKFIPEVKYMDKTFQNLRELSNDENLSSRIRFALLDLVELRENRWKSRRGSIAPKTLNQVRKDVLLKEQEDKRESDALNGNRHYRQSTPTRQQRTTPERQDWNTVPTPKSSRSKQGMRPNGTTSGDWNYYSPSTPTLNNYSNGGPNHGPPKFYRQFSAPTPPSGGSKQRTPQSDSKVVPRFRQNPQRQKSEDNNNCEQGKGLSAVSAFGGNRFDSLFMDSAESSGMSPIASSPGGGDEPKVGTPQPASQPHPSPDPTTAPVQKLPVPPAKDSVMDVPETVKNIFDEYLSVPNPEDTLFWIKDRFPGNKILDFVDELSKKVTEMSKERQQVGAGRLIKALIQQNCIKSDEVLDVLIKGLMPDLPDIQVDSPKVTSYLGNFLLEIFSDEPNLDWILQLSHPLHNEEHHETWIELISTTLTIFKQRNEQLVKNLWSETKHEEKLLFNGDNGTLSWLSEGDQFSVLNNMMAGTELNNNDTLSPVNGTAEMCK